MDYGPIFFLFKNLFRSEWSNVSYNEEKTRSGHCVKLKLIKFLPLRDPEGEGAVEIGLQLTFGKELQFLVIEEAETFSRGIQVLTLVDFLRHHGKRLASRPNDFVKPGDDVWVVTSAKNMEAFFVGYDNLARLLGFPTLFTSVR